MLNEEQTSVALNWRGKRNKLKSELVPSTSDHDYHCNPWGGGQDEKVGIAYLMPGEKYSIIYLISVILCGQVFAWQCHWLRGFCFQSAQKSPKPDDVNYEIWPKCAGKDAFHAYTTRRSKQWRSSWQRKWSLSMNKSANNMKTTPKALPQ